MAAGMRPAKALLALLVATCPCALSLATPTALTAATGRPRSQLHVLVDPLVILGGVWAHMRHLVHIPRASRVSHVQTEAVAIKQRLEVGSPLAILRGHVMVSIRHRFQQVASSGLVHAVRERRDTRTGRIWFRFHADRADIHQVQASRTSRIDAVPH